MDKKLKTEIDDVEIMIGKVMQIGVILAAVVIIFGLILLLVSGSARVMANWCDYKRHGGTETLRYPDDGDLFADSDAGFARRGINLCVCG